MVFSSLIFLFIFLPVFLIIYYLTPFRFRSLVILTGSYIFYAWWRVDFLALMFLATLWNYFVAHRIVRNLDTIRGRRWLQAGVIVDLLTLGIFKYFNFGIDSINAVLSASDLNTIEAMKFILPIGISFYIFHSISFLVDVYRKDAPPPAKFADFAAFIALFPQLVAGPVLRYKDLFDQFTSRTHTFEKFSHGAYRFMIGFSKKVLIADTVATLVEKSFALENPSMGDAWLGALGYTIQLYFDFSGYSDMAVGLGMMLGFRFIENFNYPYISRSITEFWRRWHISLSSWLRDYLYVPLGGNRKGVTRTYINLFLTMLLGGLWHGANWTYVLWGAWHGLWLAIERALGVRAGENGGTSVIRQSTAMVLTFFLVVIGWVMFRAETVGKAMTFYKAMFAGTPGFSEPLAWQITGAASTALIAGCVLIFVVPFLKARVGFDFKQTHSVPVHLMAVVLFILSVIKLTAQSYSPFLYFQF
jgi:alginate O-acetyltransferase complex protein AlgI